MDVRDLGILDYEQGQQLQAQLVVDRHAGRIPDTLLLLEHPPVITLGRGTHPENLLVTGDLPVVKIERGGDVTLHAPGQVVGYFIRRLDPGRRDLHAHLRSLESFLIEVLARHGVQGQRVAGKTGVWVESRKIASIGIACRHWVTFHGFAINVDVDLDLFKTINPCGFDSAVMTSLVKERANRATVPALKDTMRKRLREPGHELDSVISASPSSPPT